MQQVAAGPQRAEYFRRYKFRVLCAGRVVAGVSQVGLLRALAEGETEVAGATLSLRRGLTRDREFERWAGRGQAAGGAALAIPPAPPEPAPTPEPRDLIIECYDGAGARVACYRVSGALPSELVSRQASGPDPELLAIHSLTLRAERWVREPAGP